MLSDEKEMTKENLTKKEKEYLKNHKMNNVIFWKLLIFEYRKFNGNVPVQSVVIKNY